MLRIAENLKLPVDAVTESIGILAKRRSGKSYTARRLVEQLHKAHQQVVIIDPKGDWWGVIHGRDGKSPGLPFVVCGGEHGHVPIEVGGGETVARLVVEQRVSIVLDLSRFRKHEVSTFMTGFLEALYRLKARESYRDAVMLVIDEADAIAPQRPMKGEERMLGAAEDLVRRGGQRGIGVTLITQRAAVLNKNVLTQISILITLRTIAPQDREAIDTWIEVHGTKKQRATMMESLAALPQGTAWVWAPGWPMDEGIFQRVDVLPIETFDSFATPKAGQRRVAPKNGADVDLEAFKRELASSIERAKSEDPKELRKQIVELKRQLTSSAKTAPPAIEPVEVSVLKGEELKRAEALLEKLLAAAHDGRDVAHRMERAVEAVFAEYGLLRGAIAKATARQPGSSHDSDRARVAGAAQPSPARRTSAPPAAATSHAAPTQGPRAGLRRMMIALADRGELDAHKLAVRSQVALSGGSFGTYLSRGRTAGWIEGGKHAYRLTAAGTKVLGDWEPLPSGAALREYWAGKFGNSGARRMLDVICAAYPGTIDDVTLSERSGIALEGGSFGTYLSRLRTLDLVEGPRNAIRASDELFD